MATFSSRLVVGALAALALVAIAGCRSAPGVAAYVGETRITEKTVDGVVDEVTSLVQAHNDARSGLAPDDPNAVEQVAPSRRDVVSVLVLNEMCAQLRTERSLQFQEIDPARVAAVERLPLEAEYTRARVQFYSCLSALESTEPAAPTEADLRNIYERGRAAGLFPADTPFEQVAPQLDGEELRLALAQRRLFQEATQRYDVTVNPRYEPLEVPVLSFQGGVVAVAVPLSQTDDSDPFIVRAR